MWVYCGRARLFLRDFFLLFLLSQTYYECFEGLTRGKIVQITKKKKKKKTINLGWRLAAVFISNLHLSNLAEHLSNDFVQTLWVSVVICSKSTIKALTQQIKLGQSLEAHSEPSQISITEGFVKIVNGIC